MKKLFLSLIILLSSVYSYAQSQTINLYSPKLSILAGMAFPTTKAYEKWNLGYGDAAFSFGVQFMPIVSDYFNVGIEGNFSKYSESTVLISNTAYSSETEDFTLFLSSQIYLTSDKLERVYIPFGAGIINSAVEITGKNYYGTATENFKDTSFSFYVGLGVQGQINEVVDIGVEGRYTWSKLSDKGFSSDHNFISVLLKLSFNISEQHNE